ncbi:TIR domain-containing protein [Methylosoma difficile]
MSLRKKGKEIKRLISAFEIEAAKFHDIKFSTYFITSNSVNEDKNFESPNHAISLWQYYGKMPRENAFDIYFNNLKNSDLQWGVRGAELSSFGIIEGESCNLFVRMAKRAGSLFNENEAEIIKSRVLKEFCNEEIGSENIIIFVTNEDKLSIWLNYLLYFISMTYPGSDKLTRIDPDPFSLSLLALEQILDDPKIEKIKGDSSLKKLESIKFKVAFSFPGEKRDYVSKVVELIRPEFDKDSIFYDFDYQSQLAKPSIDTVLQNIYRENAELIVVFLCAEYAQKEWCGLELRAIRDIIKAKEVDRIMYVRFDDAKVDGVLSIDGYIDANKFSEAQVSKFILERLSLLSE